MIKLVHCKKEKYDIYIGRPSIFGNPWSIKTETLANLIAESREEAVLNYYYWLTGEKFLEIEQDKRIQILENLDTLNDKVLGCWCGKKLCHGDALISILNKNPNYLLNKINNSKKQELF